MRPKPRGPVENLEIARLKHVLRLLPVAPGAAQSPGEPGRMETFELGLDLFWAHGSVLRL